MQDTNDLLEDVLAGKIELESVAELHIRKLLRRFRQVVHHLLQSTFQRNHECSARLDIIISLTNLQLISFDCFVLFNHRRELVGCLVTRYVDRILNTIQHLYGQPPAGFSSLD